MSNPRFRAWSPKWQQMFPVEMLQIAPNGAVVVQGVVDGKRYHAVNLIGREPEFELMQSTGLKDRTGRLIFGKDIVTTDYSRNHETPFAFKVEWGDESGQWLFDPFLLGDEDGPLLGIEEFAQSWEEVEGCEVIGDIYRNPSLLATSPA